MGFFTLCFAPLWWKNFGKGHVTKHLAAQLAGLQRILVPTIDCSRREYSPRVSDQMDHLSTDPNFHCSFSYDLAFISLLTIQGSKSSFLTLIVLTTLNLEAWHLPGLLTVT